MPGNGAPRSHGEYRLRDGVSIADDVLVSTQPLVATRLNGTAIDLVETLDGETFRSPVAVASEAAHDADPVVQLFERLHRRGFLEWRPARDREFKPPVSVVVTVRNDRNTLERCLDALAELAYPTYEVIVVDDGSTDGTGEMASDYGRVGTSRVRVLSVGDPDDPLGIGASRNRGVAAATHDVLAFTDADCRPRADWLADLVPILATADLVGGRIRPAGDTAASAYEGINSSLDMGAYASRVDPNGDVPYLATANLIGHRSAFESVPFPDRSVAEDVDVCWRAVDAGLDVVYSPTGVVEHAYRDGNRDFAGRRATYGASEALLARDYGRNDGGSVGVSILFLLVVPAALLASVGSGLVSSIAVAVAGLSIGLVGSLRGWRLWGNYRRLSPAVSAADVARSWGRERLSSAYAVSREITRYYAGPALLFGGLAWLAGGRWLGIGVLGATVAAVVFPSVVEHRIHDPDTSMIGYGTYYVADHFGYQYGTYRGAFAYRTFVHLSPVTRFRLTGVGASVLTRLRSDRDTAAVKSVTVGTTTARFRVDSSAEEWWFADDQLRGERPVVSDLLDRIDPDDVFFDVGANVGLYSCLVGRELGEGTVVSFEPHPENASRLAENVSTNDVNARVVHKALGSETGYGVLTSPSDTVAGSGTHTLVGGGRQSNDREATAEGSEGSPPLGLETGSRRSENETPPSTERPQSTRVVTGDSLVASGEVPHPTVIKIDVEGAEIDVLDGLKATLSQPSCRLVYCELHPESLAERGTSVTEATAVFREKGFSVERVQDLPDGRTIVRARSDSSE